MIGIVESVAKLARGVATLPWQSPLLQVRVMLAAFCLTAIGLHCRPATASPLPTGPLVLRAEPPAADFTPVISLTRPGSGSSHAAAETATVSLPETARRAALTAAARPRWQHLDPTQRQTIATGITPSAGARLQFRWSGTTSGNAALLDEFHSRWRGQEEGAPCDFVIGNGHRSPDGCIEFTRRWHRQSADHEAITVCLITPAQESAVGELILCLEARTGTLALRAGTPAAPAMLAALE
jgi:hypothetical protein